MKEVLKELRVKNRYSQELLVKLLGLSRQAYMKYESGDVEPSVEIVRKLAAIYKVPYEVLIDNKIDGSEEEKSVSIDEVEYPYGQAEVLSIATPTPEYLGMSNSDSVDFSYLSHTVNQMQKLLFSLQMELNYIKDKLDKQKSGDPNETDSDKTDSDEN